jgi:hypothetical protein
MFVKNKRVLDEREQNSDVQSGDVQQMPDAENDIPNEYQR